MHPRANEFPQSISLTTKKRSAQGSLVPHTGARWRRGFSRAAARHMVTNKFRKCFHLSQFFFIFSTCGGRSCNLVTVLTVLLHLRQFRHFHRKPHFARLATAAIRKNGKKLGGMTETTTTKCHFSSKKRSSTCGGRKSKKVRNKWEMTGTETEYHCEK